MTPDLRRAIATRLGREVTTARALHGGDIHSAFRVELGGGEVLFVKSSSGAPQGMFTEEARGLEWLRSADSLRIPAVRGRMLTRWSTSRRCGRGIARR